MTDPIDRHAGRFPKEIAAGIEGLDNKRKRAIFVLLYDQPGLSFTEIRNELSGDEVFPSETLTTCLDELKVAGLVDKQIRDADDDTRFSTAYSISNFGEQFFRASLGALGSADGRFGSRVLREVGNPGEEIRLGVGLP